MVRIRSERKDGKTPAASHLFKVREDATDLDDETAGVFHRFTAKKLFLTKRARPDIQTAVAFLTTRVSQPDEDDWKKLTRSMRYLRGTKHVHLKLTADRTNVVKWWVDGSHGIHPNCRGHTGAAQTLGKGVVYAQSTKQKINTKSSTETELVAVDDVIPQVLWTKNFLTAQGYENNNTILHQDNRSTILLEENGKASSTKRTKHISCRYFFVTDSIKRGQLKVEHCGTADMIADFFTKPLQGQAFHKFRKLILNSDDEDTDPGKSQAGPQECVAGYG